MADARDPEDQLRGIIRHALKRHAEESYAGDTTGAADSVLAALADEIPDGYDDLLRQLAERRPERIRCTGVGQPTAPCGRVGHARVGLCPVCGEQVAASDGAGLALEHSRWADPQ